MYKGVVVGIVTLGIDEVIGGIDVVRWMGLERPRETTESVVLVLPEVFEVEEVEALAVEFVELFWPCCCCCCGLNMGSYPRHSLLDFLQLLHVGCVSSH